MRISFFFGLMAMSVQVVAQNGKGAFSSALHVALNACQIDGDGASGYHKFGYTIGTVIAQNLGKNWQYETGIAFSDRGARYPFNPDMPDKPSFHYRYQTIDLPVFLNNTINSRWVAGAGIRTSYLIRARETEGIHLHVMQDSRRTGILASVKVHYKRSKSLSYRLEYQYGLFSIYPNAARSLFFPTGAYHNCISAGIQYNISSEVE